MGNSTSPDVAVPKVFGKTAFCQNVSIGLSMLHMSVGSLWRFFGSRSLALLNQMQEPESPGVDSNHLRALDFLNHRKGQIVLDNWIRLQF